MDCSEFHQWLIHLNPKHGALYWPYVLVPNPQNLLKFPEIVSPSPSSMDLPPQWPHKSSGFEICLLLIDKARAKEKTYICVSVWWKTKAKTEASTRLAYRNPYIFWRGEINNSGLHRHSK